ncbi:hypothetical protein, partial [Actinomyces oris]|uniref:hypothetical protein n=1 Tax=Actinomyces oris TaxID=544580 RepID=UPI001C4CBC3D
QVGTGGMNGLAQVQDLAAGDSRATIRHGGLLLGWIGLNHQRFSQEQAATLFSDTLLTAKHPKHPYE